MSSRRFISCPPPLEYWAPAYHASRSYLSIFAHPPSLGMLFETSFDLALPESRRSRLTSSPLSGPLPLSFRRSTSLAEHVLPSNLRRYSQGIPCRRIQHYSCCTRPCQRYRPLP